MGHDTTETRRLGARRKRLLADLADVNAQLREQIPDDAAAGIPQADLVDWTGLTRETVRRWCLPPEGREAILARRRVARTGAGGQDAARDAVEAAG